MTWFDRREIVFWYQQAMEDLHPSAPVTLPLVHFPHFLKYAALSWSAARPGQKISTTFEEPQV